MDTTSVIEKTVKKIYERFLNGADIWIHQPRAGRKPERQRINHLTFKSVKDLEGNQNTLLDDTNQYMALITAVLVATDTYKYYQPALERALQSGERISAIEMFMGFQNKQTLYLAIPYGDLRLGRNGRLTSQDDSPYLVSDEVKSVEAAIEKIIGEPRYRDEYALCDKCHKLLHLIPDTFFGGLDFIDIVRYSGGSDEPMHYRYHTGCIAEKTALDAYAYRDTHLNCIVQRKKLVGLPSQFGAELVEMPETYETGLHGGEKADPWKILRALNSVGISAWLRIYLSQFSVSFNVLVRPRFALRAMAILAAADTSLGYDPAESLKTALRGDARIVDHPARHPEESRILFQVVHADAEPVVDLYHLSAEEVLESGFPR